MELTIGLAKEFLRNHPAEAARVLENLQVPDMADVLAKVPDSIAAPIIQELLPSTAALCLARLPVKFSCDILERIAVDVVAMILRNMNVANRDRLLERLGTEMAAMLNASLVYPEDTAAGIMDPAILAVPENITVDEAWHRFEQEAEGALFYLYVVDRLQKLVGVLTIRVLALSPRESTVGEVARKDVASLHAKAALREVLAHPGWLDFHSMPVVDEEGRYIGAIRYERIRRLERGIKHKQISPREVGSALGELYWFGVVGMLEGFANTFLKAPKVTK